MAIHARLPEGSERGSGPEGSQAQEAGPRKTFQNTVRISLKYMQRQRDASTRESERATETERTKDATSLNASRPARLSQQVDVGTRYFMRLSSLHLRNPVDTVFF